MRHQPQTRWMFRRCIGGAAGALLLAMGEPQAALAGCPGDCGGDRRVTVDELLTLVNVALDSAPLSSCQGADRNRDGRITVDDLLGAVNRALAGCPPGGCEPPPANLVAWYPMDDVVGPEITDVVRGDNTGTAGAGLVAYPEGPQPVAGKVGGALAFGAPAVVRVADADNLDFGRGDFSIDAWVHVGGSAPGVQPIADKRDIDGNGGVRGYQLFLFDGRLGVQLGDAANANNTCAGAGAACTNYVAAGPSLADGRPHHVAVTVRRAGQPALTLYVDGAPVFSDPAPRLGDLDTAADLTIAHSEIGGGSFTGWIDELEIFNRALTAAEVAGIVAADASGKCRALDHFLCYRSEPLPAGPLFAPPGRARVIDQFGAALVEVEAPAALCAPANKNDEDAGAAAAPDHLRAYPVRPDGMPPAVPGQKVVNQFGTLFVDVLTPSRLLVPSAKNLEEPPAAPPLPAVDHFLCHGVQLPRGAAPFESIPGVRIEDQFGALTVDVVAPTRLCAPADKNGEAPTAPRHDAHLMCYQVRLSPRITQPPDGEGPPDVILPLFESPAAAVYTNNQFGPEGLRLVDVEELCVPSRKNTGDDEPEEPLNCDDGQFCTDDRMVEYEPEADFEPPPSPTPGYTPPKEKGCEHDWKFGPAYGDWLLDREGNNITPCCEESSDCDDGNPCTHDVCLESTHGCRFEALDPEECGMAPIPAVVASPSQPCFLDEGLEARLCDIACIPGQFGDDCPTRPEPLELHRGSADVHHHLFDEEAYGARWRDGKVGAPLQTCDGHGFGFTPHGRVATLTPVLADLAGCPVALAGLATAPGALAASALVSPIGPAAFSELIGKIEGSAGDTGLHLKRRSPGSGWPRWDALVHQRGHGLLKAHQDGLQVIVVAAGGYEPFCELLPPFSAHGCDEMDDVDRQIARAHQFAAANASWVQIALGPQDAINIINSGKLAMVIAIETTDLFNTLFTDPTSPPDAAAIAAMVQKYYDPPYDVRAMQLAHETDNGFSGAALINPLFEVFQFADHRYGSSCNIDNDCAPGRQRFGFDVRRDGDGVCKNELGLMAEGELLIQAMIDRGMLIDIAHMSERAMLRTYQLAKQNVYYPLFHSHTKFRELEPAFGGTNEHVIEHSVPAWVVQKIRRSGGLVGLRIGYLEERTYTPSGVANDCAGSSRSLAQSYEFGRQGLKVPMAMGTDLNAFTQNTRPRFIDRSLPGKPRQNPNGACSAGFRAEGICQARTQTNKLGTGYDRFGLGDTGLTIDVLRDLEQVGLGASEVAPMRAGSAEQFIRMWLRANDLPQPRKGPADLANDIDLSGIAPYRPKGLRELDYPQASCAGGLFKPRYCPNSEQMGDPCRFDGECAGSLICGGFQPFCGLPAGTCVCHGDHIGCPSGYYCKLRNPVTAADNVCREQKDAGARCLSRKECKSNECKFTVSPFGPHCT